MATGEALPLSDAEADALLAGLAGRRLLVAFSGGPDSTALLGLVAGWALRRGEAPPAAATIDHGLRNASASEARDAAGAAARLGVPHTILRWEGHKPVTGVQEAARKARYALLTGHARAIAGDLLVTAHTRDDQAETVLMRLSRGSGLAGLAGMRALGMTNGIGHARPLLGVPKARLVATCEARGWTYLRDPSNQDPRFARSRWRALAGALAAEGLDDAALARFAARAAEADDALMDLARHHLARSGWRVDGAGWRMDAAPLADAAPALRARLLALALTGGGQDEPEPGFGPRLERLERAAAALGEAAGARTRLTLTLHGQVLTLGADGVLSGRPETARRRGRIRPAAVRDLGNAASES